MLIVEGSSPRMRGTLHLSGRADNFAGIIPAYAGNTPPVLPALRWRRDHPRVCGEHLNIVLQFHADIGSSPRMRGTPRCYRRSARQAGIIPAYAGNTCRARSMLGHCRDHPRVCGEHWKLAYECIPPEGSSPRMRGTRRFRLVRFLVPGIIPAYAGNTLRD